MTDNTDTRVLVALDFAHPSGELLQRLPELLGSTHLELTGFYVEDEDLLRAARLPGLREISLAGQELELSLDRLQRDLAMEVQRVRSAFESIARELSMRCRFEVARGQAAEALSQAASASDFVIVTRTLRASGLRPRRGPQFGPLLQCSRRILFVNEPWASGTTVVVLGDDPAALAAGRRIARTEALGLVVAVRASMPVPEDLPAEARVVRLTEWTEDAIAHLCLVQDARLLITPGDDSFDTTALLCSLMDRLPCSLLKLG